MTRTHHWAIASVGLGLACAAGPGPHEPGTDAIFAEVFDPSALAPDPATTEAEASPEPVDPVPEPATSEDIQQPRDTRGDPDEPDPAGDSADVSVQPEVVQAPGDIVSWPPPGSEGRTLLSNDQGTESVLVSSSSDFTTVMDGLTYRFRAYVRFRMPHPGRVTRVFVYLAGGAGAVHLHLSSGFPGGHFLCLDEQTGEDPDAVGPLYRLETDAQPGWRAVDVSASAFEVGGFDEFFVVLDQFADARVGLGLAAPKPAGDYESYAGLIADVPGDQLACFPTLSTFSGPAGEPLVWLVRSEIEGDPANNFRFERIEGEPTGSGHAAFADLDGDGDDDLLTGGRLWINDGSGGFFEATSDAGLDGLGGETVFGDYDNDGYPDILAVGSEARLFHNNQDGTFTEVTGSSGISIPANSQGVAWFDFDADGLLDFYAASYGTLADPEVPARDYLFRNRGDGTFEDVTGAMGMPTDKPRYHGRGVAVADEDMDGDLDIYVGNYRLDPNQLWRNRGGLSGFDEVAAKAGVQGDFSLYGYGHTIGPGFGDLDGDARPDLVVPNLAHPRFLWFSDRTMLYLNQGDGTYRAIRTPDAGIRYDETHSHAVLFDMDQDGDLDLYLTAVYPGRRAFLYENDGSGFFRDATYESGLFQLNGWGAAASDVDQDGDLDLMAGNLWRNLTPPKSHFLKVRLVGGARPGDANGWSNRDAIGAVVVAEVGGRTLLRTVEGGTGVGCQNSRIIHLGLGSVDRVTRLTVQWPSGRRATRFEVPADQTLILDERLESMQ